MTGYAVALEYVLAMHAVQHEMNVALDSGAGSAPVTSDGIVCFAGVDWWYHNRGHSECQIMRRLARHVPVLWVNSIGMRMPRPGVSDMFLQRCLRKLASTLRILGRDNGGMWIYSPLFVPRYTARMIEWNGALLAGQVTILCRWLGIRHPAVWVTLPTAAAAVERCSCSRVLFNRCDDFSAFPEADAARIRSLELRLLKRADQVLYVSPALLAKEAPLTRSSLYLGHGVDFSHFAIDRPPPDSLLVPALLRKACRPIVGFFGALDDYTVDLPLLIKVARHVAPGTLIIIGRRAMDLAPVLAEPNVLYLGYIEYADLPRYACQFDVAIMPKLSSAFVLASNPIKLKEYLAVGCPIVTTRFPAVGPYEDLLFVADDHEAFLRAIQAALRETDPLARVRRRAAVAGDTWDAIAWRVAGMLGVKPGVSQR